MSTDETDTITISLRSYQDMQADTAKLCALEAAGVDNWSGYDQAMRDLYGEDEW